MERLADGFDWSEGPVWDRQGGFLLFSDVPMNTVFHWKEGEKVRVFLKPSGYTGATPRGGEPGSNGLNRDPEGRLVLCQHGDRRVARLADDGKSFVTLADRYEGKRFNSPNDSAFKSNGDLYFTDPPYGLLGLNNDPAKEIPFNGVYRLSKDGKVTLLTKEMTFPNGIAFLARRKPCTWPTPTPDKAIWMAFPVESDGTLGKGEGVLRLDFDGQGRKKGPPRRDEGRRVRQPVRHRAGRCARLRPTAPIWAPSLATERADRELRHRAATARPSTSRPTCTSAASS
ncbi:MAG: SMP-30/gluconolactonase/LRE family protein [Isosphaeraceae bacterium]